jgi:hypothetical protein
LLRSLLCCSGGRGRVVHAVLLRHYLPRPVADLRRLLPDLAHLLADAIEAALRRSPLLGLEDEQLVDVTAHRRVPVGGDHMLLRALAKAQEGLERGEDRRCHADRTDGDLPGAAKALMPQVQAPRSHN